MMPQDQVPDSNKMQLIPQDEHEFRLFNECSPCGMSNAKQDSKTDTGGQPTLEPSTPQTTPKVQKKRNTIRQLIASFAPLILFYVLESEWGLEAGLIGAMVYALVELAYTKHRDGHYDKMALCSTGLVIGLGGLSLLSDNEVFMLYTPVLGDILLSGVLLTTVFRGRALLLCLAEQQMPEIVSDPFRRRFMVGLTTRLAINLLIHGAITAWSTEQSRECWLFVSGPLQYIMFGVQLAFEFVYGRFIVVPKLEAWEDAQKSNGQITHH